MLRVGEHVIWEEFQAIKHFDLREIEILFVFGDDAVAASVQRGVIFQAIFQVVYFRVREGSQDWSTGDFGCFDVAAEKFESLFGRGTMLFFGKIEGDGQADGWGIDPKMGVVCKAEYAGSEGK